MKVPKKDNEGRLRVWLPLTKRWIREALGHKVATREDCQGVPSSISSEVVRILEEELGWFMGRRKKKILRVEFREKDEWVYDELLKLVQSKKDLGYKDVTVNFEVARLLKSSLVLSSTKDKI